MTSSTTAPAWRPPYELLYALYFGTGCMVGAYSIERDLLTAGGPLARRRRRWTLAA